MRKLLYFLMLLLITKTTYSQDSYYDYKEIEKDIEYAKTINKQKAYSNVSFRPSLGIGMIAGGTTFIIAGALTTPTYEGGSTTILKPWYHQPGFLPILSGATLVTVGIVVSFN